MRSPISMSGHDMAEPIFAAGMMADLMVSGAYAFACYMACPHSWAATPIAAMDLEPYTLSDRLSVCSLGL